MKIKKYEDYFDAVIPQSADDQSDEIKICPNNYILSKEKLLKAVAALFIRG